MNHWRVGSISMGIILMAVGILMLVSLIVHINMYDIIMTLWPAVMVCLGAEMLLYIFIKKGGARVKYDILSILFISAILLVSTFFYSVTFVASAFEVEEDVLAVFGVRYETVYAEFSQDLPLTNEVMFFSGIKSIRIISAPDENVRIDYNVSINSTGKEYAESVIGSLLKFEGSEKTYIISNADMFYNDKRLDYPIIRCTLYLPHGKTVDLSQYSGNVEYDSVLEEQIIKR